MAVAVDIPSVSKQAILNCSLPVWYEQFKNITFKSVFIPLPPDFVTYLKADGVILPRGCSLSSYETAPHSESESSDEEKVDWSDSDGASVSSNDDKEPYFPSVVEKIEAAIMKLGGCVIPKLNWSSPRDASWLLPGNTMKCTIVSEVILLLKSSDFVAHDLTHVFDYCIDKDSLCETTTTTYTLCLRKWAEFHPSTEFRCFVRNTSLIAVSQRDRSNFYSHLVSRQDDIRFRLTHFFKHNIRDKFPEKNYVFDVCSVCENDIRLVDFNPFSPATDPLLFSLDELSGITDNGEPPAIRVIESESTIQPNDLQDTRVPQDIVDLASGEDIYKFIDFLKMNKMDEEGDTD